MWAASRMVARYCHLEMAPVPASRTLPTLLAASSPGRSHAGAREGAPCEMRWLPGLWASLTL